MLNLNSLFGKKNDSTGIASAVSSISEQITEINPLSGMTAENRQDTAKFLDTAIYYLMLALVFLASTLTVPVLADWFDIPKLGFVLVGSLVGLAIWSVKNIVTRKLGLNRTPLDLPILMLVAVAFISAALSNNRVVSLTSDPVLYSGGALMFFLIGNLVSKMSSISALMKSFLFGVAVIGAWSVIQNIYTLAATSMKLTTNVVLLSPNFSLTGSPLSQLVLILIALPLAIGFYAYCKDKGQKSDKTIVSIILGVLVVGLVASIYTVFKNQPFLMPVDSSWRVATGTLGDSIRAAFLGTGPGNYVDAYSIFKPTNMNVGNLWNLRFSTGSNFYFYILTTLGIAGLSSVLLLVIKFARLARARFGSRSSSALEKGLLAAASVALLTVAFVPAATTTVFAIFIVLGLLMAYYKVSEVDVVSQLTEVRNAGEIRLGIGILSLAGIVLAGYFLGRIVLADYYMGLSFNSARNNKGTDTYNQQVKAISFNPWSDSYRVTFAQTNLALADSLAGQPNLTDQQKQAVVQLVQQSIREARNAVSLQPQRAGNWENLSLIYRNLINFAQGSDQWAVVTQNQAISLDPVNPRLRLDLGGIYYALGNYQAAAQVFSQAVNLKPDYANAHYNLAQSLKQLKVNDQALAQLQLTASLVCSQDSETADCQRVNAEITELGSTPASPAAGLNQNQGAETIAPASPSGSKNLPNAKTTPPVTVGSPSGEIAQ